MKDRVRSVVLRRAILYRLVPVRWIVRRYASEPSDEAKAWIRQVLREREEEV